MSRFTRPRIAMACALSIGAGLRSTRQTCLGFSNPSTAWKATEFIHDHGLSALVESEAVKPEWRQFLRARTAAYLKTLGAIGARPIARNELDRAILTQLWTEGGLAHLLNDGLPARP